MSPPDSAQSNSLRCDGPEDLSPAANEALSQPELEGRQCEIVRVVPPSGFRSSAAVRAAGLPARRTPMVADCRLTSMAVRVMSEGTHEFWRSAAPDLSSSVLYTDREDHR